MPIDSGIALSYKPIQVQDPLNTLAKTQELQLGQAKFQEYQRGLEEQNALRDLIKSGVDLKSPEAKRKMYEISPEMGMKFEKSQAEIGRLGNEAKLKEFEVQREKFGNLVFNPSNENIIAHLQDSVLNGQLGADQAKGLWGKVAGMNEAQRKQFFTDMAVTAEKRLTADVTKRGQDIQAATTRRGQDLQYNPELQGKIEEAKVLSKARAEDVSTQTKDVSANRKALKAAGYDVATGKDEISDLIKKSTGSYLGKGADIGGAVFGKSTEGAKALAALETRANAIVYGLHNGKLGAGISNADRDFIVAQLGNLASGTTPVETRLAAWTEAKNRMKDLGMVEEPTAPTDKANKPTPTAKPVTPPAGAMKFLGFEEPAKK